MFNFLSDIIQCFNPFRLISSIFIPPEMNFKSDCDDNLLEAFPLTLFRMSLFGAVLTDEGGARKPKICHTYPTMMKVGTVIPYLKKIQESKKHININYIDHLYRNHINHWTHPLSSANKSVFSRKVSNFCYIKKYECRFHFNL